MERQNLTMRMGMRRFIPRTNGFSKRIDKHAAMIALWFCYQTGSAFTAPWGFTPAMAAGLTDSLRNMEWIVGLIDASARKPRRPKKHRKRAA